MEAAIDYRKCKRFLYNATVLLEDEKLGAFSYGKISNMSGDGMYFETEFPFKRGTRVKFRLDHPPFKSCPNTYHGTIKWCKELGDGEDGSRYSYGIGVEFY